MNVNGFVIKGAAEGTVFYGTDLSGQTITDASGKDVQAAKGDWYVKSATAQVTYNGLSLGAGATFGSTVAWPGPRARARSTRPTTERTSSAPPRPRGSRAAARSSNFAGTVTSGGTIVANAVGTIDSKKIVVKGDVTYTASGVSAKAAVEGGIYYADPAGDTLPNADGTQVAAQKGDFVLKSASGQVSVKNLDVTGTLSLAKVAGKAFAAGGGTVDYTQGARTSRGRPASPGPRATPRRSRSLAPSPRAPRSSRTPRARSTARSSARRATCP